MSNKFSANPIPINEQSSLDFEAIRSQVKFLQGKVLTVVDASIAELSQRKAVKDLINQAFSEQLTWISQLCFRDLPIVGRDSLIAQGIDVDAAERGAVAYDPLTPLE